MNRMDSMMITVNIAKLSRLELLYNCLLKYKIDLGIILTLIIHASNELYQIILKYFKITIKSTPKIFPIIANRIIWY